MKRALVILLAVSLAVVLGGIVLADHEGSSGTGAVPPDKMIYSKDKAESGATVDLEAAKATFEKTCSKCHALSRPLNKKKSRAGWDKTTKRMSANHRTRFGKEIPENDRQAIIEHLLVNAGK